ncbi:hypothetical protein Poli38472_013213 [Pythium oligandrum]|uniref:Glycosyl transferase family 1 domain-containing protein n=1 Tax=Pythium oligandrum TaxID=41045 RepID=A0A8K1FD90_PYTOL|nr:hypothetical protein Poli38472_013213 [Pythium oligandrum]|eukprot:TMW55322.1 hypothetical protein Poli38472_013213 [Pythium oligandrum]
MAARKDFQAEFRKGNAIAPWLTTYNILRVTVALGLVLLFVEFQVLVSPPREEKYAHAEIEEGGDFYPKTVLQSAWAKPVSQGDRVHLSLLHEACIKYKDSVIPHTYGLNGDAKRATPSFVVDRDDPDLIDKIRKCPDVDIFLPLGLRGNGYCEDSIAYTKYLESRMLPAWAIEMQYVDKKTGKTYSYHDLCPKTPMIFLNHYWDGIPDKPEWPVGKSMYLMPNIEMYELKAEHYWGVNAVLCKTAICARRVRQWYQQEGNPKNAMVLYSRHTSSDIAALARSRLGADAIKPKNFSDVRFVHTAGTSVQKGTRQILDCWVRRPDFPKLDIYINEDIYKGELEPHFGKALKTVGDRIQLHLGRVGADEFGKLIAEAAFVLCTSLQEGYGHYINQARASGAVIISTNIPPMNEFLSPESAVLIDVARWAMDQQMLGGDFKGEHGLKGVEGFTAWLTRDGVCNAVEKVLRMTPEQREAMAKQAQIQYDIDTNFFATKMSELRAHARGKRLVRSP